MPEEILNILLDQNIPQSVSGSLNPYPDLAGVSAREQMEEELLESLQIKK